MSPNFDGVITALIIIGMVIVATLWGFWELIDWLFIDDAIRSTEPLIPDIELVIKDNKVDTVYVYRKP
jgi:CHASE2 domain-containing sensor protein